MIGRAGRPQYGDTGTAIVLTTPDMVKKYEEMLRGGLSKKTSQQYWNSSS